MLSTSQPLFVDVYEDCHSKPRSAPSLGNPATILLILLSSLLILSSPLVV